MFLIWTLTSVLLFAIRVGTTTTSRASQHQVGWPWLHAKANDVADNFFYKLGYRVARHPKLTLLISLVLVLVCCWGFKNFEYVTDGESLGPGALLSVEPKTLFLRFLTWGAP